MRLEIPRELKSPNVWNGRHWRYKHRETQQWQEAITAAYLCLAYRDRKGGRLLQPEIKRRVVVARCVPSKRNFIKDDDNLAFSCKPLLDALKRIGLIHDDSREWIDRPMPTQEVSSDGKWRTVIEIEPA